RAGAAATAGSGMRQATEAMAANARKIHRSISPLASILLYAQRADTTTAINTACVMPCPAEVSSIICHSLALPAAYFNPSNDPVRPARGDLAGAENELRKRR